MELARARLVEGLDELARVGEMDVTVVFDAAGGHNVRPVRDRVLGVEVVFTGRGISADATIEAMALAARSPKDVTVATSDRATQEAVFSRGVLRMSSRELVERLGAAAREAEPPPVHRPATVADLLDEEVVARLKRLGY
jgi:predicted RNA-binding protein with PIN domain